MNTKNMDSSLSKFTGEVEKAFSGLDEAKNYRQLQAQGASTGIPFDETEAMLLDKHEPVGILIRCGYIVDGIQVLYKNKECGKIHGSDRGGGKIEIIFDEGDELASIEGDYGIPFGEVGGAVSNLVIKTRKGKQYGPFGSGRGTKKIKLELPKNGTFCGFCGYAGTAGNGGYLAGLGIVYKEK